MQAEMMPRPQGLRAVLLTSAPNWRQLSHVFTEHLFNFLKPQLISTDKGSIRGVACMARFMQLGRSKGDVSPGQVPMTVPLTSKVCGLW